jgi:uncharacterized protein (TIGR01777 family)
MRIVIAGGSGFCGRLLAASLTGEGDEVTILSRHDPHTPGCRYIGWDGSSESAWIEALEDADALINLCGRSVNCRYTADHCAEIYASRLDPTRIAGEAIRRCVRLPRVWLNASSATIYRHAEDREMDEIIGELGKGFSVDVCRRWERELFREELPGVRRVAMRSAMVFAALPGGAWDGYAQLVRMGLGGSIAGGRQYVSWIHAEDFCRAVSWLLRHDEISGPVNLAAPAPLSNCDFMRALRKAMRAPIGFPTAHWMISLGTCLMKTEAELVLKSRRVVPRKLLASGFEFNYTSWMDAANAIGTAI